MANKPAYQPKGSLNTKNPPRPFGKSEGKSEPTEKLLIVMVGLPYSGKSTVVDKLKRMYANSVIVCPDDIRIALHGHKYINQAESFVWATAFLMIRSLFARHDVVIVDACHTSHKRREAYTQFFYGNFSVDDIQFLCMSHVSKETCLERLQEPLKSQEKDSKFYRSEMLEHTEKMEKVIKGMAKNLTWPTEEDFKNNSKISIVDYVEK